MGGEGYSNPSVLPPLPMGWRAAAVDDLCEDVTSGGTPLRSNPDFFIGGQHYWFKTGELKDSVLFEAAERITHTALENSSAKLFPKDTVLMAMYGDGNTITSLGILGTEAATNQACCAMLADRAVCEPRFLFYALRYHRLDFIRLATGGAQRNLSAKLIRRFALNIPPLPEQRAIAHILGTLDDKIELNRRMSETLEAMARALFNSWFVDFDPVRAKAEGRDSGLPKPLADLLPSQLVDSELGEIPEGWPVETLADHFEAVKGLSYKGSGLGDDGMPLHNLNSVYEGGGYKYEGIKYYSGKYAERHIVLPGDVIVANTEQGHDRLLIGYAALVPASFGDRGIASHHIYRLRPKHESPLTAAFLCWLLNSPQMHDVVSGYANGTTVNMLPCDGVQKPLMVRPPTELVAAFDSVAMSSERRREEMISESRTLAALRDTLLPKLISGELRVQEAEKFIEGLSDG
jgi:type I restriction enzyme, S subunit